MSKPETYPSLDEIYDYHKKIRETIIKYFALIMEGRIETPDFIAVANMSSAEIYEERDKLLKEEERRSCFVLLTYIEATFKAHFLHVVDLQPQSVFFPSFDNLYRTKVKIANSNNLKNISVKADILSEWENQNKITPQFRSDVSEIFNLRNWFAHGRYFTVSNPKYDDFDSLYIFADDVRKLCLQEGAGAYMS